MPDNAGIERYYFKGTYQPLPLSTQLARMDMLSVGLRRPHAR